MIHYTCDRCRRRIEADTEVRYAVEIEMKAVFNCAGNSHGGQHPIDDDGDHLMELHEILERLGDDDEVLPERDPDQCCKHFDLCSDCYKVYAKNPLARDFPVSIQFSEN